ncbi:MAG: hypothetical protein ACRDOH_29435 [Streptosporangiaceae bacterium]
MPAIRSLTASQRDWLRVRSYLQEHRHALAVDAAGDYPAGATVAGTPLLAAPGWQLAEPVPLQEIRLELSSPAEPSAAARLAAAGRVKWQAGVAGPRLCFGAVAPAAPSAFLGHEPALSAAPCAYSGR